MSVEASRSSARMDEQISEAAWLYYHDHLNQNEIAERMQLSRATVANYLSEARLRQWVKVYLDSEVFLGHDLSAELCSAYGLQAALIVPSPAGTERIDSRVALAAADWLPRLLSSGDRLGVSWGETVYRMVQQVPRQVIDDLTVVQLLGSRPAALGFAAETCTTLLAQQLGADCVNLHVPLLLSDHELVHRLKMEPVVAKQLRAATTFNKTVLACGTCDNNAHIVQSGLLSKTEIASLRAKGAVGVICGRLIDDQGEPVPSSIEDRMIGVSLDQMHSKMMSLLVAAGAGRAAPARAAIMGGYATHLATSTSVAEQLLESAP